MIQDILGKKRVLHARIPLGLVRIACHCSEWIGKLLKKSMTLNSDKYIILKQRNWICDVTPLQDDLGFIPAYPLRKGLEESIEWYKRRVVVRITPPSRSYRSPLPFWISWGSPLYFTEPLPAISALILFTTEASMSPLPAILHSSSSMVQSKARTVPLPAIENSAMPTVPLERSCWIPPYPRLIPRNTLYGQRNLRYRRSLSLGL